MKVLSFWGYVAVLMCACHDATSGRVVCYFGSWAVYRTANGEKGKFQPEDIDPNLCTHVIYSFAGIDENTFQVKVLDPHNDLEDNGGNGFIKRINNLRNQNRQLKSLIAIGGWNEGSSKYSKMVSNAQNRKAFITSALDFIQKHRFDGLDLDWEYPTQRGGTPADKQNFASLIQEMRPEFDQHGLLLTAAVASGKAIVDAAYDVPALSRYLHFINLMTYDFHGSYEKKTGHNAPLRARPDETGDNRVLNVEAAVQQWIEKGAAPSNLNLGMAMYGHSFTLANPMDNGIYTPASGAGAKGPYTQEGGTLAYYEICEAQKQAQWTVVQDEYYKAPYAYHGDQWVGYDDENSIRAKCDFAIQSKLGGGMIWSVDMDDFRALCGKKYPLLSVIHQVLGG